MTSKEELKIYINEHKKRLKNEMPRVRREIKVYEEKLANGRLTQSPNPAPQFNV